MRAKRHPTRSDNLRRAHVQDQIDQYVRMIEDEIAESGEKSPTVKELEKKKDKLEEKLAKLMNVEAKDEGLNFEHTGIDHLFVVNFLAAGGNRPVPRNPASR